MTLPITPLPAAPTITDPTTFESRADTFIAALPNFVTQANALAADLNNLVSAAYTTISFTLLTIGTGSQSFTVEANLGFIAGQSGVMSSTADPSNRMSFTVTSYDKTTGAMVVDVTSVSGSGTHADWVIGLAPTGVVSAFMAGVLAVADAPAARGLLVARGFNRQDFAATGTFTVPDGVTKIKACGRGNGGGAGGSSTSTMTGGGGGEGGYSEGVYDVTPGDLITITFGSSGAGGIAGNAGTDGGDTTIVSASSGTLMTLHGGKGGGAGGGGTGLGGVGGAASGGTLNIAGEDGSDGSSTGGAGAGRGGGGTKSLQSAGRNAQKAGAGGAASWGLASTSGGNAASGWVVIEW